MQTISRLAKLGLIETHEQEQLRSPKREAVPPAGPLTLSEEQQAAFDGLNRQMQQEKPGAALLYGVTGSGKTSVYLALIQARWIRAAPPCCSCRRLRSRHSCCTK